MVQQLARKLLTLEGVVNEHYRKACIGNLLGGFFELRGVPLPDTYFIAPSGGMLIEESYMDRAIRRWSNGDFSPLEEAASRQWREATRSLSLNDLVLELNRHFVLLPKPDTALEIVSTADRLLSQGTLRRPLLLWVLGQLGVTQDVQTNAFQRWSNAGQPFLDQYAPFAHHCLRTLLAVTIAVRHKFVRWNPTHLIDTQYLYYLPFCKVFSSDDHVHRLLAPQLCAPWQIFVPHSDLKSTLSAVIELADDSNKSSRAKALANALLDRHRARTSSPFA
jgi:hypothetical protein